MKKLTLQEIDEQIKDLEKQKETIKQSEVSKKKKEAQDKIDAINIYREAILSVVGHSRTTCSDHNVSNGYSSDRGYARCSKCHLIEILDGYYEDGEFDVSFDVTITKVQ